MGFTIEDMLVVSADKYQMKLVAGEKGWSNSISWLLMLEDLTIIQNFSGKELAVTTGLGFQTEEKMLDLVRELSWHNAAGLIVNTGYYIREIPEEVKKLCDHNDLPLLTVPWEVYLADMIKDMSVRIFLQSSTDEQISGALIRAIESPGSRDLYEKELLPHFDLDGTFQTALVTTGNLDSMDTVERKRISYRMQLYLTNLTHNGHFLYYDGYFVIVMNDMKPDECADVMEAFADRAARKMPERRVWVGVSDQVADINIILGVVGKYDRRTGLFPYKPCHHCGRRRTVRMDYVGHKSCQFRHLFPCERIPRPISVGHRRRIKAGICHNRIGIDTVIRAGILRRSDYDLRIVVLHHIVCIIHQHIDDTVDHRRKCII